MKRITTILALILSCAIALGATVTLLWDPNAPEQGVVEYRLYEETGTNYTLVGTATNNTLTLAGVGYGQHTWVLTAVNSAALESEYSDPASTNILADLTKPTGLRIVVVITP